MTSPTLVDGAARTMAKKWISKSRRYAEGTSIVRGAPYSDDDVMKRAQSDTGQKVRSMVASSDEMNEMNRQGNRQRRDNDNSAGILYGHDYNKGTKKVPGKGSGDTVSAKLTPGEAVLNKNAAEKMGRDKIAKANAAGNRAKSRLYKD